jgi:hypothetical protein
MQFFIALGIMVALASAHLLHQYWSRALAAPEPSAEPGRVDVADAPETEKLKAA